MQPGEPRVALVVATNLAQGRLLVRMVRAMVERSPLLRPMLESASEDELRFEPRPGVRCWLQAKPCSSRGLRGPPMSFGTMDEAAHHLAEGELGNAATAERVFQALIPGGRTVWRARAPVVVKYAVWHGWVLQPASFIRGWRASCRMWRLSIGRVGR